MNFISVIVKCFLICFALSIPVGAQIRLKYIPVQQAAPLDFSDIERRFALENQNNVEALQASLQTSFVNQIVSVDMLPLRKKIFQDSVANLNSEITRSAMAYDLTTGHTFINGSYLLKLYRKRVDSLFDAVLIQSYKEEYRRVKDWEVYLRDKNLLDAPYKQATQSTGLTNREALSALYGTSQVLFDKVNWR